MNKAPLISHPRKADQELSDRIDTILQTLSILKNRFITYDFSEYVALSKKSGKRVLTIDYLETRSEFEKRVFTQFNNREVLLSDVVDFTPRGSLEEIQKQLSCLTDPEGLPDGVVCYVDRKCIEKENPHNLTPPFTYSWLGCVWIDIPPMIETNTTSMKYKVHLELIDSIMDQFKKMDRSYSKIQKRTEFKPKGKRFDSLGTSLPDPKPYQKRSVESIVKMLKRQYSSLSVDRDETKAQNKLRTNQLTYVRNLLDSINNIPDVPPHLASKTIDVLKMWDGVLPLDLMQKLVWLSFFREELSYLRLSKWSDREEEMRELRNKLTEYIKLDIDQTLANHWNVEDYKDKFRDYFYNLYFHGSIYEKEIFDKYRHMMET